MQHEPPVTDTRDRDNAAGIIVERVTASQLTVDMIAGLAQTANELRERTRMLESRVAALTEMLDAQVAINREAEGENQRLWSALARAQRGAL